MAGHVPRSINQIVEEQARRWELGRREAPGASRRPVIAVSRQHGAGGALVAQRLAQDLSLDLFDREIIQQVAESASLSARVVSALDEKDREVLTDWLAAFASVSYMSPNAYREHLTRVVGAIACHGGAVILGRGAHLILGPARALRVFVVAPLEARVAEVARRDGIPEREARRRIVEIEDERQAFLARHFHSNFADPSTFDLVVNTGILGIEGSVGVVRAAITALPGGKNLPPGSQLTARSGGAGTRDTTSRAPRSA